MNAHQAPCGVVDSDHRPLCCDAQYVVARLGGPVASGAAAGRRRHIIAIDMYGSFQIPIHPEDSPDDVTHTEVAVKGGYSFISVRSSAGSKTDRQVLEVMLHWRAYLVQAGERSKPWISKNSTTPGGCASQVLLRINACVTAVAAAFAMSFVMSATASAQGHHRTGSDGDNTAAHTSEERPDDASSGSSTDDGVNGAERPTDDADLPESAHPAHDKCKRRKGNRPLLPWCTDPASGWMGSTTLRVRSNPPELRGICEVARSCRP